MGALQEQLVALVRRVAKERGVVLSHIPDRAGVSRSHFWEVMKGRNSPTLDWLEKVAACLDSRPEILLHRLRETRTETAAPERPKRRTTKSKA